MPENNKGLEQNMANKPKVYISTRPSSKKALVAIGSLIGIVLLILTLNYFHLISLSKYLPKLTFLSPNDNKVVLVINNKQIRKNEYQQALRYIQQGINDPKKSAERTKYLFITSELLEEELLKQGYAFKNSDLYAYLNQFKNLKPNNSSGYFLDMKVAFLKEKLYQNSVNWYSGYVFMTRLTGAGDSRISDKERAVLAEAKIEKIRKEILTNKTYSELDSEFSKDKELEDINSGQAYAITFERMSLKNPTITSPEILQIIEGLKKNQVSQSFKMTDPKAEKNPIAWAVVKITDLQPGTISSVEDWLKQTQSKAQIKIYGI